MIFIGIDPGLTGGLAAVNKDGEVIIIMPFVSNDGEFNPHTFSDMLGDIRFTENYNPTKILAGVEKVHSMPGQGVSSSFKFGNTYGKIQGVLAAKHIAFELITPQAWTKVMLAGESKSDGKSRGPAVCQRLYPHLDLRANDRCRVVHSGMADALLIAEFLRRKSLGLLGVSPIIAV